MSKIQTVRLINIGYNNNAIRISDECFHMNGESTLLSLRNGGGKSVLVQMMTAPFVHKRYRDVKDRPFESYFTTNKPSFILVEWALDQGAGDVLTGMMVRRSQASEEESNENLEIVNIVSEYSSPCPQDIHNLAVVKKGKREMTLKNYSDCRQMFEEYKKNRAMKFFCYDMGNPAQSRQYFEKLSEYQIHYKEWETIIKKVNLKESGLSELFADCRDEKGLVEKWFLDAVESKLNKEKNRMKEFQDTLSKYVGQYKANQASIKRHDTIQLFKEDAARIREKAERYREAERGEQAQENLIANFIAELGRLHKEAEEEERNAEEGIEEILGRIAYVEYEKISSEIHKLDERRGKYTRDRDMLDSEREDLENQAEAIARTYHLLLCAKQDKITKEEQEELERIRQKLEISKKAEEELEPERLRLGYGLRVRYEKLLEDSREKCRENENARQQAEKESEDWKKKLSEVLQKMMENAAKAGTYESRTESYGEREESFNRRYNESLSRNILGEYDPGTLDIKASEYEKALEGNVRRRLRMREDQERAKEQKKSLVRSLEDMRAEQIRASAQKEQQEKLREEYEEELEDRRVILRYLDLDEKLLFEKDEILHASKRKLLEIDSIRRNLEKEEDGLQKEYKRLTEGKYLELSEEMESAFEEMGIHIVYGMEWLKKNGRTNKENVELVRRHPFLPYALMLSEAEIEKLAKNDKEFYTSAPVPIVMRNRLEEAGNLDGGGVVMFPDISFYVYFNESLLDEKKLEEMTAEKRRQIEKKQDAIEVRRKEYEEYFKRQEQLENQKVSKGKWDGNRKALRELEGQAKALEKSIRNASEELGKIQSEADKREQEIRNTEKEIESLKRRIEDFEQLSRDYGIYEKSRRELEKCREEEEKLIGRQKLAKNQEQRLKDILKSKETEWAALLKEREELKKSAGKYSLYEKIPENSEEHQDFAAGMNIREMEARYDAATSGIARELNELKEQEQRAAGRYERAQDELSHLERKYGFSGTEFGDVIYSRQEELHQENMLEGKRREAEMKERLWHEKEKKIAEIVTERKGKMKRLEEECGEQTPLEKEKIKDQDFDARKNKLLYEKEELERRGKGIRERMRNYDENLTALAEYSVFQCRDETEWKEDFSKMGGKRLREFKGELVRDYNHLVKKRQSAKDDLTDVLNQVARRKEFEEDFYKKPIESMLELTQDASQVLSQLSTTIQSYDSLIEKLKVDISMVEKEKENIVGLLEDYLKEVHQNLGKIDHNSTISIRKRPVKMLKILLPEWEENEGVYRIHLQDMIDAVTQKGLELFEKNENAQEYFGTQITTKNLYDAVVGIGNVQIRLYKIEAQREYPITWAEVARNSGGEGFLSAFVILSSLLYYMRKDDTDIFADRNEGKVLIMDNPFAQTNASHLLKPLMDVAKKTNTQMICLTGLSGESIYNRFDNIYVLNLIAASLRNGMQYLKADHLRGNDPDVMVVSQIEVARQQELVF